ncbi:MAG: serine hydrolase domain-containing protein [Pseudomonadota bacterium]
MRRLMTTALCVFSAACASASDNEALQERPEFDAFLKEFRIENRVQSFSVAVAKDGDVIFSKGYGWQDHDAEEPTTRETSYLVASITKTFTAATLLAMEADGHIDLQTDFTELSDWDGRCAWLAGSGIIFGGGATLDDGTVVEPVPCETPITLEQVLSHRVNGEPGSGFLYNPVVFGRLSNFVEEQTDRSWRDWMRSYVVEPAGLDATALGWRDPEGAGVLTHLAPPFRHTDRERDPDGIAPSVLPNPELNASSGVIASAEELTRYGSALLEGRILDKALLRRMWTPPAPGAPYALGWWVEEWKGERVVWHGGWWPDAYAGVLLIMPERGLVFAAQGNADGIHWGNPLNRAAATKSPLVRAFLHEFAASEAASVEP